MEKRLIIWGTGNTGSNFYNKYKDVMSLNICTSSDEEPVPIEGMEAVHYKELDKTKDFIIICSIYHEEIEKRLYIDGWVFGCHYMTADLFEAKFMAEKGSKKLLVSIGRCHIGRISTILNRIPEFKKKYVIVHFDQPKVCISDSEFDYAKLIECIEMLKSADIFLCPASVTSKTIKDYEYLEEKLPAKCTVIRISLPTFGSYWPQDIGNERDVAKWYITPYRQNLKAFSERDYIIEGLIESGKSKKEIIDIISDENYFDKETVLANHNKTMARAYFWDRIANVKIADFIEENYKIKKLYCDRGHLHQNLLKEYVKRILIFLSETENICEIDGIWEEQELSMPTDSLIYPSTAKGLGLDFIDHETLYRFQMVDGSKLVTFSEGLEMQIEYYMRARSLLEMCYVNREQY